MMMLILLHPATSIGQQTTEDNMSKRHQSIIHRHSEAYIDEDNWIHKLEQSLKKDAVQPKRVDQSLFDQISHIMNGGKSKYPSVQAAVDDMKQRSGLTAYLEKEELSKLSQDKTVKKASDNNDLAKDSKHDKMIPIVIRKCPKVEKTIRNYIEGSRGNLPIPAIIDKIKSIHMKDVSEASDWEDDNLIRYVSKANLAEKSKHNNAEDMYSELGRKDDVSNADLDASNTDAFNALMPAKL